MSDHPESTKSENKGGMDLVLGILICTALPIWFVLGSFRDAFGPRDYVLDGLTQSELHAIVSKGFWVPLKDRDEILGLYASMGRDSTLWLKCRLVESTKGDIVATISKMNGQWFDRGVELPRQVPDVVQKWWFDSADFPEMDAYQVTFGNGTQSDGFTIYFDRKARLIFGVRYST